MQNIKHLKTSVIIPVYNEKDYLERCLRALTSQSRKIHEIIVVDNNSTDTSVDVAKAKFGSVIFLNESTQGTAFARNTGFDAATGDILVRIDADSLADADWHEHLVNQFQQGDIDGWSGYVYSTELNRGFRTLVNALYNISTFRLNRVVSGSPMLLGANCAITSMAWKKSREGVLMRNDIWEDLDLAIAVHSAGLKIATSRVARMSISNRAANDGFRIVYRRLRGQTRLYFFRGKYLSTVLSVFAVHVALLLWVVLSPLSMLGRRLSTRSRPEQY